MGLNEVQVRRSPTMQAAPEGHHGSDLARLRRHPPPLGRREGRQRVSALWLVSICLWSCDSPESTWRTDLATVFGPRPFEAFFSISQGTETCKPVYGDWVPGQGCDGDDHKVGNHRRLRKVRGEFVSRSLADPEHRYVRALLSLHLARLGQIDEAIRTLEGFDRSLQPSTDLLIDLGFAYLVPRQAH